jgi:sec-independent protein translocase protein TatC
MVFVPLAFFARELYSVLAAPLLASLPAGGQMIATDVVGVFLVPMKVALAVAFLIALPYVLYQVWAFVAPGLYAHEKKLAIPLMVASILLFFIGMAFAYFAFFPMVFGFMAKFAPDGVAWMTDIEKYFSFVLTMFLAFGVTFEVPVIVIVLVKIGLVKCGEAARMASLCDSGRFRGRGGVYATRRDIPVHDGRATVAAYMNSGSCWPT